MVHVVPEKLVIKLLNTQNFLQRGITCRKRLSEQPSPAKSLAKGAVQSSDTEGQLAPSTLFGLLSLTSDKAPWTRST